MMPDKKATFGGTIFVFKKSQTNLLYATYLCIGGLGFEPKIGLKVKMLYYVWQVGCLIFGSLASLVWFYELCQRQKPTFQQFFTFAISFNNPIAGLVADFIAYSFRRKIRLVLRQIDDDFGIEWGQAAGGLAGQPTATSEKMLDVGGLVLLFFVLGKVLIIVFLCSRLVAVLLSGRAHINDMYYFLFAVPVAERVDTMAKFVAIATFQILMSAAILLKGLLIPLFLLSIGGILSNQFVRLTQALANESEFVGRLAETESWNASPRHLLRDVGQTFRIECVSCLKIFRHLIRISRNLRGYIEASFLFSVVATFAYIIPICYMLREPIPVAYKISSAAIMVLLIFVFFIVSYISKLFDEVNESVTFAIYDTSWYNLPARQQRFMHMFLCEAQQTKIKFNILRHIIMSSACGACLAPSMRINLDDQIVRSSKEESSISENFKT